MGLCGFRTSLVYIESSRSARLHRETLSQNKQQKAISSVSASCEHSVYTYHTISNTQALFATDIKNLRTWYDGACLETCTQKAEAGGLP